jgi:hypothetical protein
MQSPVKNDVYTVLSKSDVCIALPKSVYTALLKVMSTQLCQKLVHTQPCQKLMSAALRYRISDDLSILYAADTLYINGSCRFVYIAASLMT